MAIWNTDKPAVGNQITADIADIEENLQELHDVIEAITNGTLGTTTAANFKVDSLVDGTTGFASATTQPFYQNSAPTGWTRNSALTDNSMFMYAASGNVATGGSVDAKATHTHTMDTHNHRWLDVSGSSWQKSYDSGGSAQSFSVSSVTGRVIECPNGSGSAISADQYTASGGPGSTNANTAPYYIEMILAAVD